MCSVGKESTCNAGDLGSVPGFGRSPGEGKGYPLQCSCLENSMDCIVHGVAKNRTQLSNFHFTTILRKLYVNSSVLAQHWYTRIFPRALKLVIFFLQWCARIPSRWLDFCKVLLIDRCRSTSASRRFSQLQVWIVVLVTEQQQQFQRLLLIPQPTQRWVRFFLGLL